MAQLSKPGIVALLAISLSVAGCSGGNGGGFSSGSGAVNPLVGLWTRATIEVGSNEVTCPNTLVISGIVADSCVANETLQISPNGTFTLTYPASAYGHLYAEYGTWTDSGSTFTMKITSTGTDTSNQGVITAADITTLATPQVIANTLVLSSDRQSFTLTPAAPAAGSNYTVPEAPNGTPVTSTFTL